MTAKTSAFVDNRGARGSNAGDDFHELWALQRALNLLIPKSEATAVTLEGVSSAKQIKNGPEWDGVDCAVYYGAETIEEANRIELAQLKYSSANPKSRWTIARLSHSEKKSGNNSVLRRLADAFSAVRSKAKANAEISIRLVSNQAVAEEFSECLKATWKGQLGNAPFSCAKRANLQKVKTATGLKDQELKAFLAVLDLSECGVGSRFTLKNEIIQFTAQIVATDTSATTRELRQHLRNLLMPEHAGEVITRGTVLGWFEVADPAALFPAPSAFKPVLRPIIREPAKELYQKISADAKMVCVHGEAGCGKTTTLSQLASFLPEDCVLVRFDCYGAGSYLRTTDRRHLPEYAYIQILNEISIAVGLPFVIPRRLSTPLSTKFFFERLTVSADLLKKAHPKALLVIAIDAADNSVTAAQQNIPPDACFITELVNADLSSLPQNVRIVFSSRTGRKESLGLPRECELVRCPPFITKETEAFVAQTLTGVDADWIEDFHELSHGIPRVQDYALIGGNGDPNATLNRLRPGGKAVSDVLRSLFVEAVNRFGKAQPYTEFMSMLAALPTPIPFVHLSKLTGASIPDLQDFVRDTFLGLRTSEEAIVIADEDVEDFIQDEGRSGLQDAQVKASGYLKVISDSDTYAAINIADILVASGQEEDILPIIENNLAPKAIADPIVQREIQLRRLRLALSACRRAGDSIRSAKIVLLSAEASKDEAVMAEILDANPDLSSQFARSSLVRLVLTDPDKAKSQGKVLIQDAARAARERDGFQARDQLRYFNEWLVRRKRISENKWPLTIKDITAEIEVYALLEGAEAAIRRLNAWKPRVARLQVALELVPRLIVRGDVKIIESAVAFVPPEWRALLQVPLALAGHALDKKDLIRSLEFIRSWQIPKLKDLSYVSPGDRWKTDYLEIVVTACEIGLTLKAPKATILRVLRLIVPFGSKLDLNGLKLSSKTTDVLIRTWCMYRSLTKKNITSTDFLDYFDPPAKKARPPAQQRGETKEHRPRFDEKQRRSVTTIFHVYQARLEILNSAATEKLDAQQINSITGLGYDAYYLDRDIDAMGVRSRLAQSVQNLQHLSLLAPLDLFNKALTLATGYNGPFPHHVKGLWSHLLLRNETHHFLLADVSRRMSEIRTAREPASEKVDAAIYFSRTIKNFSDQDAAAIFEEAIELTQEIDRDAFDQIRALDALTKRTSKDNSPAKATIVLAANIYNDIAIRLRDQDHFPWSECVKSLGRLSPPIALAAVSSWSDQGLQSHTSTLAYLLEELLEAKTDPSILLALRPLARNPSSRFLSDLVDLVANKRPDLSDKVISIIANDCLLHEQPIAMRESIDHILNIAERSMPSSVGLEILQRLQELSKLLSLPKEVSERSSVEDYEPDSTVEFSQFDLTTTTGVQAAVDYFRSLSGYVNHKKYLVMMRDCVSIPGNRINYLDALSACDLGTYSEDSRSTALLDALKEWNDSPAVGRWRKVTLPDVIIRHFLGLTYGLHDRRKALLELLEATQLSGVEKIGIILDGLEIAGLKLRSQSLYELFISMSEFLQDTEATNLFSWLVDRIEKKVSADTFVFSTTDIPVSYDGAVSRFIYAMMSDVDTRVRWKAMHTVRRFAALGCVEVINEALANYTRLSDSSFRDPEAPYYGLAARLSLVTAIDRVAFETPTALRSVQPLLLKIALDESFPHIAIREHAKSSLLELHQSGSATLSVADAKKLKSVNKPTFSTEIGTSEATYLKWEHGRDRSYDYTSDALEYVFRPILKLFDGLSHDDLLNRAEEWLIGEWKAPKGITAFDSEPRKGRYRDSQWQLWSSSKGSLPIFERYGGYLEWHAAACVVGYFLTRLPLRKPEYEWDSYGHWLGSHLVSRPPIWLSDLRSPKPIRDFLWLTPVQDETQWVTRLSRDACIKRLLWPADTTTMVAIDGEWTAAFPKREERVTISSGLVSPKLASALLRSLKSRDRQWPYHFGYEDSRYDDDEHDNYQVKSWVTGNESGEGLDVKDAARHGINGRLRAPGARLRERLKLLSSPTRPHEWISGLDDKLAAKYTVWSDLPETYDNSSYRQRVTKSDGELLQIDVSMLSSFLRELKMDVIVNVHVQRRIEEEYGKGYEEPKKSRSHENFFVLRADGKIEDVTGIVGTW